MMPWLEKLRKGDMTPEAVQALLDLGVLVEIAHPNDAKAWSLSGDLHYLPTGLPEALTRYRTCIKLSPTVFSVWENALSILAEQRNYDDMLVLAEKALDDFPNQAAAYYYYGLAAIEKGKPDVALIHLEQATIMTGKNSLLYLSIVDQISLAHLREKDPAAAKARYEHALTRGGDKHPGILEHLGDALFQTGEREKATEYWQKAAKIAPSPRSKQRIFLRETLTRLTLNLLQYDQNHRHQNPCGLQHIPGCRTGRSRRHGHYAAQTRRVLLRRPTVALPRQLRIADSHARAGAPAHVQGVQ